MSDFFSFSKIHQDYFHEKGQLELYKKGQLLVRHDDASPWMFFLEKGLIKLIFNTRDATPRILAFILPGMTFTQSGSFYSLPNIGLEHEAYNTVTVWRLPREQFIADLQTNLALFRDWHSRIQENHNFWIERILYSGEKQPRDRTIAWLLCMARYYGIHDGKSCLIEIPLTQDLIAGFLHLTRESTNKIIQELKSHNLITIQTKYITIPDIEALHAAASQPSLLPKGKPHAPIS